VSAISGTDNYPMILCSVWVPGSPKTKGSLTVVNSGGRGRKAHVEDTPESKRWRMFMVDRIRYWQTQQMIDYPDRRALIKPYSGPVDVTCTFYQAIKPEDMIRKVTGSGDLDKLVRNLFDALSVNKDDDPRLGAGVILDDMQVVCLSANKMPALWNTVHAGESGAWFQVQKMMGLGA
jgi:Holliday junction resolvase RusA-like endonuclease